MTTTIDPLVIVERARAAQPQSAIVAAPDDAELAAIRALATIGTPEQAAWATTRWTELREADDAIATKYKGIRAHVEKAIAEIKEEEARDRAPYKVGIEAFGAGILAWKEREAKQLQEQNQLLLVAAEEEGRRRQQEQADAIRAAKDLVAAEDRRALEQQAKAVERAPVMPISTTPAAKPVALPGAHTVDNWHAEVDNVDLLRAAVKAGTVPDAALEPAMRWLNDRAEALHELMAIPGVRAVKVTTLAKSRKKRR